MPSFISEFVESVATNPTILLLQGSIGLITAVLVFLILFTTRDIILRTHSFLLQLFCIALVALLPIVGFLLYLLLRPPRTLRERELYAMVHSLHVRHAEKHHHDHKRKKKIKEDEDEDTEVSSDHDG